MPGEVRSILDDLLGQRLSRLCRGRNLRTGGNAHEKRGRLARSFRGQPEQLIPMLRRDEMIACLKKKSFAAGGGYLYGLSYASKPDLCKIMNRVFVDGWTPVEPGDQPCGARFPIRVDWDSVSDGRASNLNLDIAEANDSPAGANDDSSGFCVGSGPESGEAEAKFIAWMDERIKGRLGANLLIKTLVKRLGRYHTEQRLTTKAALHMGHVLAKGGFTTEPDLRRLVRSPGLAARVRIFASSAADPPVPDWRAVPAPPATPLAASSPPPLPATQYTGFDVSAAKLMFLVSVAASVRRLGEPERLLAVDRCARGSSTSAADLVRLRAMAHQYAGGQEDLSPTVRRLRETLPKDDLRQLLGDVRGLAPATDDLELLITRYRAEFGVDAPSAAPVPAAVLSAPAQPATHASNGNKIATAGGVRENAALDSLFR